MADKNKVKKEIAAGNTATNNKNQEKNQNKSKEHPQTESVEKPQGKLQKNSIEKTQKTAKIIELLVFNEV